MRSFCAALALLTLAAGAAPAAECPGNPDAIGTSRVLVVDPAEHARLGTMQYRETLPLADREVVLTFDDGPLPPYSARALDILAANCVKATYFLVGRMARAYPDLVRRIHAEGHTVGTHSQNHPFTFNRMSEAQAEQEVQAGIASVKAALGDAGTAPFFRIPGLLRGEPVEKYLASRAIMTWSADVPADDWKHIQASEVIRRAITRLEAKGRGVLLLHDIQPATVLALPGLLKELKSRGFRIVHVEPATAERPKTATLPSQWVMKGARDPARRTHWPRPVLRIETLLADAALPAASLESFGAADTGGPPALSPAPQRATGHRRALPEPGWPGAPELRLAAADTTLPAPGPQYFGYSASFVPIVPQDGETLAVPPASPERRAARPTEPVPARSGQARPARARSASADHALGHVLGLWPVPADALRKRAVQ